MQDNNNEEAFVSKCCGALVINWRCSACGSDEVGDWDHGGDYDETFHKEE